MATLAQLQAAYASITRIPVASIPAAQNVILADLATRSTNGTITDADAYQYIIGQAAQTTSVAALSYQFFTGKTPTAAGIDYLVNSTTNTTDLNDAYYSQFNLENRYQNFAANLALQGEGKASFDSTFGSLSFADTVNVAYERIIGSTQATAAGINVAAAKADITSRAAGFIQVARDRGLITSTSTQAQIDAAQKAVVIGYIMAEAVKFNNFQGVGVYAQGLKNFYLDLAPDNAASYNVDLTTSYSVGSGGTGDPGIPGGVSISYNVNTGQNVSANQANSAFASTGANDTVNANGGTFQTGAVIELGAGNDTLTGGAITSGTGSTAATKIDMGAGADTLGSAATASATTITEAANTGGIILDGGQGTDVARLTLGSNLTSGNTANTAGVPGSTTITNFETVYLTPNVGNTVDARAITGATAIWHADQTGVGAVAAAALTINNIASGQTVGTSSTGASTFNYGTATGGTSGTPAYAQTAGGTAASVMLSGSNLGLVTVGGLDQTVGQSGLATLTVSADKNSTLNGLSSAAANITVTGSNEISLGAVTFTSAAGILNHNIDGSAMTNKLALTYVTTATGTGATGTSTGTDTIKGGSANDVLTLDLASNANTVITLGGGADTIVISDASNIGNFAAATGALQTTTQVTDFVVGTDLLDLSAFTFVNTTNNGAYTGNSTLRDYADDAAALTTDETFTVFEFGGSTYVFIQETAGGAGRDAGDGLIQLVGVTGITAASITNSASTNIRSGVGSVNPTFTAGNDVVTGTAGADTYDGLGGNDTISGAGGNDTLSGGADNDLLNGDAGNDTLNGGSGEDTLNGGADNDTINGNAGADTINGGTGTDTMNGGSEADTFVFAAGDSGGAPSTTNLDIIQDFTTASDVIDYAVNMTIVSGSAAASGTAAVSAAGVATFNAADNTTALRIVAAEAGINASGAAAAGQVVIFQGAGGDAANAYVFISDGVDGVGANDVLIQLVGVDTTNAAYDTITLSGGNFTLA